jgi:competence protein ComEC
MARITPTPSADFEADRGRPGISVSGIRTVLSVPLRYLGDSFGAERTRWALWIPVFMGAGIAFYFSLHQEPGIWVGPAFIGLGLAAAAGFRRHPALLMPVYALVLVSLGFGVAQLRTGLVSAPVLQKKIGFTTIEGRIARIEVLTRGSRLWLDSLSIDRLAGAETPDRIRIKLWAGKANLQPGDRIRLRAVLHPPSGPAMPGAFDFARRAFFQRLGGVGYAVSRPAMVSRTAGGGISLWLAALRHRLTATIHETLPGPTGAVAAALMTGKRSQSN